MSVKQAILDFVDGEIRNKIFVTPGIPAKKLNAARSQFISRDEEVIVLYDDTVFGSGKDGIAITENYIYAKQLWELPKSIKISSIRSIESQSKSLNNLEIYLNGNLFITVSTPEKSDHAFLVGMLKAAKDAAAKTEKKKGKAAPTAEVPSPVPSRSAPKAKLRSAAPEDMLSCEECRAALPTGAKFCLECGSKVTPKGICLECSTKLPEQARFCLQCGTPAGRAAPVAPLGDTTRSAQNVASMPDSHAPNIIADYNNNVNVQKFLVKYKEFGRPAGQLDEELILLGFGTKGFSITQEDYDGVSQEDECFGDLICDTILPLKMELGQIRVLGTCEVRCVFVHQISHKNEDDILEVVNFYIVQFQCDTILLAIYGWYDQQEFSSEYYKIISTEGVHRTSATGYLSEMTEDLQAIGE